MTSRGEPVRATRERGTLSVRPTAKDRATAHRAPHDEPDPGPFAEHLDHAHGPCRFCGRVAYTTDETGWAHACCAREARADCSACLAALAQHRAHTEIMAAKRRRRVRRA